MRDLLDILPNDVSLEGYCHRDYTRWEEEIATPALIALGYSNISWSTGERDSWGPLTRICTAHLDGDPVSTIRFVYG